MMKLTNDLWIWLADAYQYIDSGCLMSALENEINRSLLNGFWGVWFHQNCMLGDSILTALNKMKQTDQQQHIPCAPKPNHFLKLRF